MLRIISSKDSRIPDDATLLTINGHAIEDFLEYEFYNDITKTRSLLIAKNGIKKNIVYKPQQKISLTFEEPKYHRCENLCEFCFINGLPKGLRKELYFRDDDYRLSFLFGNFLSLTNISLNAVARIGRLRLSPLYVSVHTTNPDLRCKIFKNDKAGLIMEYLKMLVDENIKLHCQIVLMPGITDGKNLIKTINDLSQLYPGVYSVGVVPVGSTKYSKRIQLISKDLAQKTISTVEQLHKKFRKRYNNGLVYLADEFYIRVGLPIPNTKYYDDFPQYENGIGMGRVFLDEVKNLNKIKKIKGKFLILTGTLALPLLRTLKKRLNDKISIDIIAVKNRFFGPSVTVSGLIAAAEFKRKIALMGNKYDRIILPPNCVNDENKFIDDVEINERHVLIAPKSINELMKCLQS